MADTVQGPAERIAFVTGGSRGIGRAITLQLGRDGYDVAFCYQNATDAASSVERELRAMGRRVLRGRCDVADYASVQRFFQSVEVDFGEPEVVVNSAGITRDGPLVSMTEAAWRDVLTTNLYGVFNVCRTAAFSFMKRKCGVIINISSVAGVFGNVGQTNYAASKAGIIGFSKSLAKEVGPYGVRVNVVAPGFISTDMTRNLSPKVVERVMPNIPLRRTGEAQEIADVVSFLASDRARYITAQTIHVDGGLML